MGSLSRLLTDVLSGRSDANIRFTELRRLLLALNFDERIKGDHHIYTHTRVQAIINLQPLTGGKAKPYQVGQVRKILAEHRIGLEP